jgi:hypothetical protein
MASIIPQEAISGPSSSASSSTPSKTVTIDPQANTQSHPQLQQLRETPLHPVHNVLAIQPPDVGIVIASSDLKSILKDTKTRLVSAGGDVGGGSIGSATASSESIATASTLFPLQHFPPVQNVNMESAATTNNMKKNTSNKVSFGEPLETWNYYPPGPEIIYEPPEDRLNDNSETDEDTEEDEELDSTSSAFKKLAMMDKTINKSSITGYGIWDSGYKSNNNDVATKVGGVGINSNSGISGGTSGSHGGVYWSPFGAKPSAPPVSTQTPQLRPASASLPSYSSRTFPSVIQPPPPRQISDPPSLSSVSTVSSQSNQPNPNSQPTLSSSPALSAVSTTTPHSTYSHPITSGGESLQASSGSKTKKFGGFLGGLFGGSKHHQNQNRLQTSSSSAPVIVDNGGKLPALPQPHQQQPQHYNQQPHLQHAQTMQAALPPPLSGVLQSSDSETTLMDPSFNTNPPPFSFTASNASTSPAISKEAASTPTNTLTPPKQQHDAENKPAFDESRIPARFRRSNTEPNTPTSDFASQIPSGGTPAVGAPNNRMIPASVALGGGMDLEVEEGGNGGGMMDTKDQILVWKGSTYPTSMAEVVSFMLLVVQCRHFYFFFNCIVC